MESTLIVNKFRPQTLTDFQFHEEFTNTIRTLQKLNTLNMLIVGNFGSGKTSLLNCIVKEYYADTNSNNYDDNVLYINNLKEQGISYYRTEVKHFCQSASSIQGKKKIVVIDDIDAISEQSQQVFRNSIDKFKHTVHFITSCTNVQKVIESIQSRFFIVKMKPHERSTLEHIMNYVITSENIHIQPDAKEYILDLSNKSIKVLLNYLEKFKLLNQEITLDDTYTTCTNISIHIFKSYINSIKNDNIAKAIHILYQLVDDGYSVMDILDNCFTFIKTTNLLDEEEKYRSTPILCKYITSFHGVHEDEIELSLFTNDMYNSLYKR